MAHAKRTGYTTSLKLLIKAAKRMGVKVENIEPSYGLVRLSYKGKSFLAKSSIPPVNSVISALIADNKYLSKVVLEKAGLRVPPAVLVDTIPQALKSARKIGYPMVVKPLAGAHGLGVAVRVQNARELKRAVARAVGVNQARGYQPGILMERYIEGEDYRFYVIDKKVWAVLKRVPAHVVGDGKTSVQKLIQRFNRMPQVGAEGEFSKPLCAIVVDQEVTDLLRQQGFTLSSVPARGEHVLLRRQANISLGGTSHDATDDVSPALKKYAIKAAQAAGLRVAGIDMLIKNPVAKTIERAGAWIIEINVSPGIDVHHYPYRGKARPVAEGLLACYFPGIKIRKQ
jgi:cyanophycin synthetase